MFEVIVVSESCFDHVANSVRRLFNFAYLSHCCDKSFYIRKCSYRINICPTASAFVIC